MFSAEAGSSAATCPNYNGPLRKHCVVLCNGAHTAMGGHIWQRQICSAIIATVWAAFPRTAEVS